MIVGEKAMEMNKVISAALKVDLTTTQMRLRLLHVLFSSFMYFMFFKHYQSLGDKQASRLL